MSSVDCCGVAALAREVECRDVDTEEPDVLRIARVLEEEDKTKINIQHMHLALQNGFLINNTKINEWNCHSERC